MVIHNLKKYILLAYIMLGICTTMQAEGNLPYVDQKTIHFGFLLGINTMDFSVTPTESARISTLKPGFTVGIISDLRLNRYLNLRFTPTLHFGERELSYPDSIFTDLTSTRSLTISSIPICLPIYLKYSAERKGNYRPYLIGGVGISYDLATAANAENPVLLKPFDFYTEFGVGCDIYFSFFKLAPELKYSIGFNDMLTHQRSGLNPKDEVYTKIIQRLTSRMITLSFNFE
ncbi:MAG: porin family protein [Paludibacter sp.]|nr:porin family protein [Paludibacter sp.]